MLAGSYSNSAVVFPLATSAFFALGTLVALLALLQLQSVKGLLELPSVEEAMGPNLLQRFPNNLLIRLQWLMFLTGAFYLVVRIWFVSHQRAAIAKSIQKSAGADAHRIGALVARAEAAENASLAPLSFVVWVLPILGFLGTVVGVSRSMGPLADLANGKSAAQVAPDLLRNLQYPFDATFTGLVLLLPMMACFTIAATRARKWIVDLRAYALSLSGPGQP
jgi:biopolymer transport protein ExbB/TolQ